MKYIQNSKKTIIIFNIYFAVSSKPFNQFAPGKELNAPQSVLKSFRK